jgi:hypothetical protein
MARLRLAFLTALLLAGAVLLLGPQWFSGQQVLRAFVSASHQQRAREAPHQQLLWADARARWRCDDLRWSREGAVDKQFARWRALAETNGRPFTVADIESTWQQCDLWFGWFTRVQIVDGRVWHVPPPKGLHGSSAGSRKACTYVYDELRLEALAAVLLRVARFVKLPNMDLLLNLWDDHTAGGSETAIASGAVRVPPFAFARGQGMSTLLLPLIAEPAFPFLDSEAIVAASYSSVPREEKWRARNNRAVFRGSVTGKCSQSSASSFGGAAEADKQAECYLRESARGKVCSHLLQYPDAALHTDFAFVDEAVPDTQRPLVESIKATIARSASTSSKDGCRFVRESMSMDEQEKLYNAQLLVDGNSYAYRVVRALSRDMVSLKIEGCCETYVDLVLRTTSVQGAGAAGDVEGEVWSVDADLRNFNATLALLGSETGRARAMRTAEAARAFALSHLNDDATVCYVGQLLTEYAALFGEESLPTAPHPEADLVLKGVR